MNTETPPGPGGASPSPESEPRQDSVYRPGGRKDAGFGRRRQVRTRLVRAFLLVVLIAGVGGLASVFLSGRQESTAVVADEGAEEATGADEAAVPGEETVQLSAEQFESTLEREGVEVFRIRGARTSSDDQGNVLLKEVEVDYPRGDDHYRLHADGATYNEVTKATHLEGAVSLQGTNGLVVDTEWMDLAEGGLVLTAADDSGFTFEGITAVGDGLRIDFRREVANLTGGVRVTGAAATSETGDSRQPLSLSAERLEYRWREGRMRATGGAAMEFGDSPEPLSLTGETLEYRWSEGTLTARGGTTTRFGDLNLAARSLTLALAQEAGDAPTSLEARGAVLLQAPLGSGGLRTEDGETDAEGGTLILIGNALDVGFDPNQLPSRLVLSGPNRGGPGVLRIDYADGSRRRVRAQVLAFTFVDGVPSEFESRGSVVLDERVPERRTTSASRFEQYRQWPFRQRRRSGGVGPGRQCRTDGSAPRAGACVRGPRRDRSLDRGGSSSSGNRGSSSSPMGNSKHPASCSTRQRPVPKRVGAWRSPFGRGRRRKRRPAPCRRSASRWSVDDPIAGGPALRRGRQPVPGRSRGACR